MEHEDSGRLDVIIIGGGPAGMAAALVAGRARLRTLVVNEEAPRNAVSVASHGLYTRDGAHATELLAVGKAQLEKYPAVAYVRGRARAVEKHPDRFDITLDDGRVLETRRLVLATGFTDVLSRLELPGIEEVYGRSVFPCPFCDGFEHADERWAVFMADGADQFAKVLRIWARDLVVFTNGESLDPEVLERLEAGGVQVEQERVEALESDSGRLTGVRLVGGTVIPRDAGFIGREFAEPATSFADELGVARKTNPWGRLIYETEQGGKTSVERLYLVGDAHRQFGGLAAASYDGATCIQHIVHELAEERWAPTSDR